MEESSSGQSRCRQVLPVTLAIQAGVTVAKCMLYADDLAVIAETEEELMG